MTITSVSSALNAYQQALGRIGAKAAETEQKTQGSLNSEFQNLVKDSIENAVDLSKKSETMTIQGIQGKADIQDVVMAVSNAEMALETVVAVRDTAIKAYQTIMQMPI